MLNYKLNATGAFTPAAVDLPDAINPEQVLHHRGSAQGRYRGGQAVSLHHRTASWISYQWKRNSAEANL